ncbi:MAG: restriction endonuclease subunit S [Microthrixaceae bacterium]
MTTRTVSLRRLVRCLDGQRVPLNRDQRSELQGTIPYWGANGIVDRVVEHIFDEELVLLGEDGAPFDDPTREVAFHVTGPVWANNHIHVLRPTGSNGRYLTYALNAMDWRPLVTGSTRDKLTQDDMMRARVPVYDLDQQRRIADFLDAETARIDALITAKQQMIDLLDERRWLVLSKVIAKGGYPIVPLRRALTAITDGPFGSAFSSSDYSEAGVAVVRLGNIGFAEWRSGDLAHIPDDRFHEFQRHRVEPGDLLIAGLGDARNHAGRACVAPELGRAIVKGKCFCARVDGAVAVADYLAMFCSSPAGAAATSVEARGSTRLMINLDIMKAMNVPLPSLSHQITIVSSVRRAWAAIDLTRRGLQSQIDLLRERRQALITAAVTGELAL